MDSSMVAAKTFALKLHCTCEGCKRKVKKMLQKYPGVEYLSEIDENEGKVTVSGTADPHALIAAIFQKHGKKVELLWVKNNPLQHMQIVPAKAAVKGVHENPYQASKLKGIVDHHDGLGMITTATKNQTSHSFHEHVFESKNYEKRFACNGCKQEGFGPRHRCKLCDYELHNECRFPKPEISHEFLKGSTLEFHDQLPSKKPTRCCIACGRTICGSFYHSGTKGWNLHPCCCNLKTKLCIDGVNFQLHNKVLSKCMWCSKKEHKNGIPGWSYNSDCKKYQFHVYCVTEMVHEAWKKGVIDNIDSTALEKMDLQLLANSKKQSGKGFKIVWKTVKIFLKTIVGILLGDPSVIIASVLVELISNK